MNDQLFGTLPDGRPAHLFTLTGRDGLEARITNYGGALVALRVPDRDGRMTDLILGYDSLAGYLEGTFFLGCLIGRFGNRIAGGRFTLGGKEYQLPVNNGPNHLHGGPDGFGRVLWKAEPLDRSGAPALRLTHTSPDGENGYPGTLSATVVYTVTAGNALRIDYEATTDADTIVNLTSHAYFNLAGEGDILGHELWIDADAYLPVDEALIPVGAPAPVAGTPFDFRRPTRIGARIDGDDVQLRRGAGYDHTFVLNGTSGTLRNVARVVDPRSGRALEVQTTQPGLQLYSGNYLASASSVHGGRAHRPRSGFCLEAQHFPDSPNQPAFPSVVLRPGEVYRHTTVYRVTTP